MKPSHEIITDYWEREMEVGQRIIETSAKQLGKIVNSGQLQIDFTPGLPDHVVYVNFRKDDPEPLVA